MQYEPVIGLEVHAELETCSKMFCACPVVDSTQAEPNSAVCPVCAGMPGTLPVLNQKAIEYGLRVALALGCNVLPVSVFARKNYFYPDLPKGYQISQYEQPLARDGQVTILTLEGEKIIRVRRVHFEEDAGKLTHVASGPSKGYTLVDLNRAGVPLLEIVTEPDFRSANEVRVYAETLRAILRTLGVNSGDMQKGVLRIEPNISLRPVGETTMGTRVEIKNLNSFRALERSVAFEIQRQAELLDAGGVVKQVTLGWDDVKEMTFIQRVKEEEDDYRYFPEPDLPPLVLDSGQVEQIRACLPELPNTRMRRFQQQYGLSQYNAQLLTEERAIADYFEQAVAAEQSVSAQVIANWIVGELFGLMNQKGVTVDRVQVQPAALAGLVKLISGGEINHDVARRVLEEMFMGGERAEEIVRKHGLKQISDGEFIASLVSQVLANNPKEVAVYRGGKAGIANFLFGQVMRKAAGKANPSVVRSELERQLAEFKTPEIS